MTSRRTRSNGSAANRSRPVGAVGGRLDGEAGVAQADRRDLADRRVVLDEQDPGVHPRQYASDGRHGPSGRSCGGTCTQGPFRLVSVVREAPRAVFDPGLDAWREHQTARQAGINVGLSALSGPRAHVSPRNWSEAARPYPSVASNAAFSRARCSARIGTVPSAASTNVSAISTNTTGTPCASPSASMTSP